MWNIKVTQISCGDESLPPSGCTQYHMGDTGVIQTYNFAGGQHLGNQRQQICIRREEGMCRICYTQAAATDFGVSGVSAMSKAMTQGCCNMGVAGDVILGPDCVIIPGAKKNDPDAAGNAAPAPLTKNSIIHGFCGGKLGTSHNMAIATTVCTDRLPFTVLFASDNYEWAGAAMECAMPNVGFSLQYEQQNC